MAGLLHRPEVDDGAESVHQLTGSQVELWLKTNASMCEHVQIRPVWRALECFPFGIGLFKQVGKELAGLGCHQIKAP